MRKHLSSLVLMSVFYGCALLICGYISPAQADDRNARALMRTDAEWSNTALARNIDELVSFFADNGVAYPPNASAAVGPEATRKLWATYLADPTFQITWKPTSAGAEKRTGWTVGTYEASFKGADGKTVVERGKYVTVWRKTSSGKWKAIHDIWNSDTK